MQKIDYVDGWSATAASAEATVAKCVLGPVTTGTRVLDLKLGELFNVLALIARGSAFEKMPIEALAEEILRGGNNNPRAHYSKAVYRMQHHPEPVRAWQRFNVYMTRIVGPDWSSTLRDHRVEALCCARRHCLEFSYGGDQCDAH